MKHPTADLKIRCLTWEKIIFFFGGGVRCQNKTAFYIDEILSGKNKGKGKYMWNKNYMPSAESIKLPDLMPKHIFPSLNLPQNSVYSLVTPNTNGSNNTRQVQENAKTFFKWFQLHITLNY